MKQHYKTKAREVWADHLTYYKKEQCYKFYVEFWYGKWSQPNEVALVFDHDGKFIETEESVNYKFRKTTIEETIEDHIKHAMNYKEIVEKLLQKLMKPIQKENIIFNQEKHNNGEHFLELSFKLNNLSYYYYLSMKTPYGNKLSCYFEEESEPFSIKLHNIPSLIKLRPYIRNHPKIRLKFVNELAYYEKSKKRVEKSLNDDLDDW